MGRRINVFRHGALRRIQRKPGADDQGTVRTGERRAEDLDGPLVHVAIRREFREVVVEAAVNYAIRLGRPAAETLEVFKITAMRLSAGGDERLSARIGASETEDLMAHVDELQKDSGTDKARCSRNKYLHGCSFRRLKDSPTSSSLFFQRASAALESTAYPRTPSLTPLIVALSGTTSPTWQFSQYLPPISSASATTPAHTDVAAPCGIVFH